MRRSMLVAALAAVLVVSLQAQAPAPPAEAPIASNAALVSKELVTAFTARDLALAGTVRARLEAMLKTPEGQAYQAALKERESAQASIQQKVAALFPGHVIDFQTGRLVTKAAK